MSKLFENLLAVLVLLALIIIIYCKVTNKTLLDVFRDLKEIMFGGTEEVIQNAG